ncbi:MAG: tRNA (N6-isopentenyl adenosine(37)-C2)-methylthiotransferase MiaB [candidate division NC10 bacterium]|nr:tRNA (N6-isopentenyl adenosine(37)-C2)-methylthiotransferase MiaB [candidate division NC10 bacterium]
MPKLKIITYGCQANELDSERIAGILEGVGYTLTGDEEEADLILVNTCSIREKAEQKVFSRLGQLAVLKQSKPGLKLGLCGCLAQREGNALLKRFNSLDLVVGTGSYPSLPELLRKTERAAACSFPQEAQQWPKLKRRSRIKAWVGIMDGCDNFCAFCVVPYTRGRERSRPPEDILKEVEELYLQGYQEITLLGQTVNSYGKKLKPPVSFAELLRRIDEKVHGRIRVRFTSSFPKDVTVELASAMAELSSVCEHIHLPVQSGSTGILQAMARGYTREEYLEKIKLLRSKVPGIAITTDLIVGFPGETKEDFQETLSLMEEVGFDGIFAFRYSQRPNTPACTFSDQVPEEVKANRLHRLFEAADRISLTKNKAWIGRAVEVLIDTEDRKVKEGGLLSGRTRENKIIHFKGVGNKEGDRVMVLIEEATPHYLRGSLVVNPSSIR